MAAIATFQAALTSKIEAVQLDVGILHQDMDKVGSQPSSEWRLGQAEDTVSQHTTALRSLQTKIWALEYKAEDAENRNRKNNLRIVGLAEGAEGPNPTFFVENLLRTLLPVLSLLHRGERLSYTAQAWTPGGPPRTFILKLLNFRDRDEILWGDQGAGRTCLPKYQVACLFPTTTQKLWRLFDQVKAALRTRGIRYSFLYQDGVIVRFYTSPCEASTWLDSLPPIL